MIRESAKKGGMSARSKHDRSSNSPLYAQGIPIEAVKDRKKLKEFQSSKFEHYAINSKYPRQHYVVGFDDEGAVVAGNSL